MIQAKAASIEVMGERELGRKIEEVSFAEEIDGVVLMSSSGEASAEVHHENMYQFLMEREYERQLNHSSFGTSVARPHEYRAMVTARLTGRIGDNEYTMLIDSGSELNIMTLHQVQDLALPIDTSGSSWTLKGISGHTMGLEGMCWNVPVKIGGIEFRHNFFVSRTDLGNKDMVLGQPWLFSQATRIDYVHNMGVSIQLWENGDRTGQSVLINLPLIKAPRNVMPATYRRAYESDGVEIAYPGELPESEIIPKFPSRAEEVVEMLDSESEKLRPEGLNEDVLEFATLQSRDHLEVIKRTWLARGKGGKGTIKEQFRDMSTVEERTPFLESGVSEREISGAKYKPVAKKVVPVSTQDPDGPIPVYSPIGIGHLPELPKSPVSLEDRVYSERLTKERVSAIVGRVPAAFLTKAEVELLVHVMFLYEKVFAFSDLERGAFSSKYYPDYVIRTVPHKPWQKKPIRLPQARREEVIRMLKEQMASGKYEPASSSYRSAFFAVEKKGGALRIVHDLQPLNAVTIRDSTLPPRVEDMIESFAGRAVYGLFDLKSGYDNRMLARISRDLTSFYAEGMGMLRLTRLPQGHTNAVAEFQRCTQHMIGPMYPDHAEVFIDDCAAKGPKSNFENEAIEGNEQIRKFVWEYALVVQELLARVHESGATISGTKVVLATPKLQLLGAVVALDGAHVSHEVTAKLVKWPVCKNPTEVRGFLGTVGVVRRWIKGFAKIAKPLTLLTKKMPLNEFEWSDEAQDAMDTLKHLASTAVPVRSLDYNLAKTVQPEDFRDSDLGLVSIHVDSSYIGVGWMITQKLKEAEYPIVFGSITYNDRESRYSQPKLELYGVFRALKAERHRLHSIHFRLVVDAGFIAQMISNPDLPNAAMTRWITYIQLFTFEVVHTPGAIHRGPDGLSRRQHADDDSDYSGDDIDIEDGIKLVKVPTLEVNEVELWEENGIRVREDLKRAKLDRLEGEARALEVTWGAPKNLLFEYRMMYVGEGEEMTTESEESKLFHLHRTYDYDGEEYWNEILAYLYLAKLPADARNATRVLRRAKPFFLMEKALWRKNGDRPPLLVVLKSEIRERIVKDAHDNSGHRGRDPTFRKIRDSYWWPNQYIFVATYCRSCHERQMRSTYRNTIPLQPQYVRTILRRFDADTVHMPTGRGGYKYVVDLVDNLTGWVEAKPLRRMKSSMIAQFLFDTMCRFGCIFQLTCDNGTEFKGATEILMEKYRVPVVRISPYNSQANGKIERTHCTYLESIWRVVQGETETWPSWLGYALWADRITVKRNTGYSPYFLLYGQHPLLPFDVTDRTFHVLDWPSATNTVDLLALRMRQLEQKELILSSVREVNKEFREKTVEAYNQRHLHRFKIGDYKIGELVLTHNEALDNQFGEKGALRWHGPFAVVARRPSGAYILQELDGSVLKQPVAWKRLKSYVPRRGLEPEILAPRWLSKLDAIEKDLLEKNADELCVMVAHASRIRPDEPFLPKPWLLEGIAEDEYWGRVWERSKLRGSTPDGTAGPLCLPELEKLINENTELWNLRDDIIVDADGEMPRWKDKSMRHREIFEWRPWGESGSFQKVQASSVQVSEGDENEILRLGDSEVKLMNDEADIKDKEARSKDESETGQKVYITEDLETETGGKEPLTFESNMAYAPPRGPRRMYHGNGNRGGTPSQWHSAGNHQWHQPPPWAPTYPYPYPPPDMSSYFGQAAVAGKAPPDPTRPPSPPSPKVGHSSKSELPSKSKSDRSSRKGKHRERRREREPDFDESALPVIPRPTPRTTAGSKSLSFHEIESLDVSRRSPSPDLKDFFDEFESINLAEESDDYPVPLLVPQLDKPVFFTKDALKTWGRAHVDYTQEGLRYQRQVSEWKRTRKELYNFIAHAYKETRLLKQHLIGNDVSQDHLYAVHEQIKSTAKALRKGSLSVADLMKVAETQMTVNVEAVRDFGTLLRAIPHDSLDIPDFYRSIRSFFIGLMWRFEKKYGVNNAQVIGIMHTFEHFLLSCDLLEPLPEGKALFMANMSSIIRDHYGMQLDVKDIAKWMREQGKPGDGTGKDDVMEGEEIVMDVEAAAIPVANELLPDSESSTPGKMKEVDEDIKSARESLAKMRAEGEEFRADESAKSSATKRSHESDDSQGSDDEREDGDAAMLKLLKKLKGDLKEKGALKRFSKTLISSLSKDERVRNPGGIGPLHFKGDPDTKPRRKRH